MSQPEFAEHDVFVTVRIPAPWESPEQMLTALPNDCHLLPGRFIANDGTEFDLDLRDPDDQFVDVFATQCRFEPTPEEKAAIRNYSLQICLTARCGTKRSAEALCHAINIFLDAGAWGMFVDNSGVAFAKSGFQEATNDLITQSSDEAVNVPANPDSDALSFAFVSIISNADKVYTQGMQILGYPNLEVSRQNTSDTVDQLIDAMRHICSGDYKICNGAILGDLGGPQYRIHAVPKNSSQNVPPHHPMYNPFGFYHLICIDDIVGMN